MNYVIEMDTKEIGKIIKTKRIEKGMSQREIGEKIGITGQAYGQYESGKRKPKKQTIIRISDALGIDAHELLGDLKEGSENTMRNSEGYWDATAGIAIKRADAQKEKKEIGRMEIKRGDIWMVEKYGQTEGSVQQSGRPAIVVSNDIGNKSSNCVNIIYLTTQPKGSLPTHVNVMARVPSTALCDQIHTVSKERLTEYMRCLTEKEMQEVNDAIMISLGMADEYRPVRDTMQQVQQAEDMATIKLAAERDIFKQLYDEMLKRIMD